MQLKKLFAYFKGYVTLRVEGKFLEKFLNLALHQGIYFFDAKTLSPQVIELNVLLEDFWQLRHITKKVYCTIRVKSKHGLPFIWSNLKKRKMLLVGFICFIITLYLMSGFIWQVEIKSYDELYNISEDEIAEEVYKLGLKPGALKMKIDRHELEKKLAQNMELLSWVAIDFQGTKAIVKVVERVIPSPEQLEKNPAHVVAVKDGIIEEFLVMVGEPKVKVGDTVHQGQILISGLIYPQVAENPEEEQEEGNLGEPRKVKARGIVRASVWYQVNTSIKLHEVKTKRTGNYQKNIKLAVGNKIYLVKGQKNCIFANFETEKKERKFQFGDFTPPLKIIQTVYHEVEAEEKKISLDEAVKIATRKALRKIEDKLPQGAKILDHQVEVLDKNKDNIKVKVLVKSLEDITKTLSF
ncbi:MAG: hypothetical protein PWQ96_621 [Clostridia bacterium]|jgi:similar to stage IV sporulation protein|nr:sporulation protein YqfD [Clostridiales bacterium]MDK2984979.1 hypothetical protein [Clostridia bacterium]